MIPVKNFLAIIENPIKWWTRTTMTAVNFTTSFFEKGIFPPESNWIGFFPVQDCAYLWAFFCTVRNLLSIVCGTSVCDSVFQLVCIQKQRSAYFVGLALVCHQMFCKCEIHFHSFSFFLWFFGFICLEEMCGTGIPNNGSLTLTASRIWYRLLLRNSVKLQYTKTTIITIKWHNKASVHGINGTPALFMCTVYCIVLLLLAKPQESSK